jgi:hypothetical protein
LDAIGWLALRGGWLVALALIASTVFVLASRNLGVQGG